MRVLLIHTNQFNFGPLPRSVEKQRGLNPPISLAYIASTVKRENHIVQILDMDAEKINITGLGKKIMNFNPDVVGFSVMLNNLIVNLNLARFIKSLKPNVTVIFGGIQINLYPEYTIKYPSVDIGVIGEGEFTFPQILNHLELNKPLNDIKGIVYKDKSNERKIYRTEQAPPIINLDEIPFPARELLPIKKYSSLIARKTPITISFSSRGCPYHCTFCSKPDFWNSWRFHSPSYVADEFENIENLGIKEVMVYDDIFTANKKRVASICKEIIKRKIDLVWDIRTRADMINVESLKWLKAAGCNRICYGVESGNRHMLDIYNKGLKINQIKRAFDLSRKFGFEILAYFMIGGPDETENTIKQTFQTMRYLNPDYVHLTAVVPYPKTELFNLAIKRGLASEQTWLDLSNHNYEKFPMFTDGELTREDIFKYVKKGNRYFYYRPVYMLERLKNLRNFTELWKFIKAAISI